MAIGRPAEPIDFSAIDMRPVKLIVLLASPPARTADHIQALGKISRLMSNAEFRDQTYRAESGEALYELFRSADA
jgi:mannitol/fructose-specific phosphotransferase system IIA component (Ntr-type)